MTPEQYRKRLEEMVANNPIGFQTLIQMYGPLPDGKDDAQRGRIIALLEEVF
jgi:hypothetical protein